MAGSDVVLYHGMASTCSKKVRLCLYEKGIAFESHLLDLQKFEQHRPDYLALNPNGVVPTLVHRDRPIIESSVIIEYLDDAFPEVPLKPADPYARAQMRLWLKYSDEVAYKAVYAPTWQFLRKRRCRLAVRLQGRHRLRCQRQRPLRLPDRCCHCPARLD